MLCVIMYKYAMLFGICKVLRMARTDPLHCLQQSGRQRNSYSSIYLCNRTQIVVSYKIMNYVKV